jgi:zinc transport system substrate-binding protein
MTRCDIRSIVGMTAALAILACAGCTPHANDLADGRLPVFVGIPPLAYLVEQIGGARVRVGVLLQAGQDPHTFEPMPQQILALNKTRLFFQIGMPFERILLDKVRQGNERLVVVDTARGIQKRAMDDAYGDHALEPSGREGARQENRGHPAGGELDPHIWLAPRLLKQMAQNIAAALERADAAHARVYAKNLDALSARLDALHEEIGRMLEPYRGKRFYVFHPGFGYFADAYGLKQVAIEEGGRPPTPKQLQTLISSARNDHVKVIFVQPQSPQQSAQVIAEAIEGKVVTIDGLAKDVPRDIEDMASKIDAALRSQQIDK